MICISAYAALEGENLDSTQNESTKTEMHAHGFWMNGM